MPKITFKTYRGNDWEYDIITRRIARSSNVVRTYGQPRERRFFSQMEGVSREHFDDQINNHAEILILNVTDRCNLRCKYCAFSGAYHGQRVHGVRSMSIDTAIRGIDQFIARTSKTRQENNKKLAVTFYGGEPLREFQLIKDILHYIHEDRHRELSRRISHSITTNGTLLDAEKMDFLSQYDFSIRVSVDGPKEFHDKNRIYKDGSGTFDEVVRNLMNIRDTRPSLFERIGYIVTLDPPFDYLQRADFFDSDPLFSGHLFLVAAVAITNCNVEFDTSRQEQDGIEFSELLRQMHAKALAGDTRGAVFESGLFSQTLARLRQAQSEAGTQTLSPNGCCIPGQRRVFLSTDGHYFLCDKVAQNENFSLGDVDSGISTDRAWRIYNDYLTLSKTDCLRCPFGNICDYCPSSALQWDYMGLDQKRVQCSSKIPYLKKMLELYASLVEDIPPEALDNWIPSHLD